MRQVRELRGTTDAFLIEPGIGIRRRLVRVVLAALAAKIPRRIARGVRRRPALVFGPKALVARPRFQQRAVDRKVLVRQETMRIGLAPHRLEEGLRDVALQQPVTVLRKRRMIPHALIQTEPDEPAKQQVVVQLLDQQALAAHTVEHLQQQGAQQLLGRNGRPPDGRVQLREAWPQPDQRRVRHLSNRSQRMIARHALFGRHVTEQEIRPFIVTAHRRRTLLNKVAPSVVRGDQTVDPYQETFSTPC